MQRWMLVGILGLLLLSGCGGALPPQGELILDAVQRRSQSDTITDFRLSAPLPVDGNSVYIYTFEQSDPSFGDAAYHALGFSEFVGTSLEVSRGRENVQSFASDTLLFSVDRRPLQTFIYGRWFDPPADGSAELIVGVAVYPLDYDADGFFGLAVDESLHSFKLILRDSSGVIIDSFDQSASFGG